MASVQVETNHGAGPNCPHPPWKLYHNPHYSPHDTLHRCPCSSSSPSPRFSCHGRKIPEPPSPMIIAPDDDEDEVLELDGYGAMSSELELCVARIRGLRAELDLERRMRRKAEALSEALATELAEERRRGEAERRALREEAGAARAEADRVLEDVEEERRMLRVAELWREERVQMKLADARAAMEEKMREVDDAVAGALHGAYDDDAAAAAAGDNNRSTCSSPDAGKSPCSSSQQQGRQSPSRSQHHRREPNSGGENPHIRRGIKGFVEFPRAVRVRPRDRDRDERVDLVSNLECQRAQLRVLMRHRSPAAAGIGLIGAAENLVVNFPPDSGPAPAILLLPLLISTLSTGGGGGGGGFAGTGTATAAGSTALGTPGGVLHRMSAQLTPSKKGCCLISAAPRFTPSLLWGSLASRPLIRSRLALLVPGQSGNLSCCPTTLNSVARFVCPLNGVLPYMSSCRKMPNVHQSTALPWPSPLMISGARYSCVPTNDIDRAPVGSTTSSGRPADAGCCRGSPPLDFLAAVLLLLFLLLWPKSLGMKHVGWMQVGWAQVCAFRGSEVREDLTSVGDTAQRRERSKSESMMWPSSLTRTFSGFSKASTRKDLDEYLAACSGKCLPGWRCRSAWRSPPGQNSMTRQANLSVSKCAYSVGRNGWSSSCRISSSVCARLSFRRLSSDALSITFIANQQGLATPPLPPLSSDRYTVPMSPHPSRRSRRKLPMARGPSRARAARMAFHLGSPPLCGFPALPPPPGPLLQPLPSLAAVLLTLVLALRLVTVQLGAMLVTVAAAPELSMLLCGLAASLGVGDASHEMTGFGAAVLSRASTATKTVSMSSTGSGGWLAPEKELLGGASPSASSSLDAMLILTLSNSNPRTFSVALPSPFLPPPPPTPTPPICSSNTSGTNRNWKSWYSGSDPGSRGASSTRVRKRVYVAAPGWCLACCERDGCIAARTAS
ncbi:hypothetical protein U9M48_008002 [Paspalum notatum var. saurae]|uniref:GTD-binding domain-containing protein n=1 Tax=Paspalum notatum var. saurae TaxID=547442 RepID=A0AAQ3WCF8_PASNO